MSKERQENNKNWNNKNSIIFFVLILFILVYPLIGGKIDTKVKLNGTVNQVESPKLSVRTILDGSYQATMESYVKENLPGRNLLIKMNNQLKYSLFNESSNSNVVIGKDKQLYEPEYIDYSLNRWGGFSDDDVQQLIGKLDDLDSLLQSHGKQLYIFITPSKVRYYKNDIPWAYKLCLDSSNDDELAYDKFVEKAGGSSLNIFDSIAYIDSNRQSIDYPLWYSTGIHWSRALGANVAEEFNKFLKNRSGYDLGQIQVSIKKTDKYIAPDTDLYDILNLIKRPQLDYYTPKVTYIEGTDKPNIFLRGGSFMGQSLSLLISAGEFNKDIHFENNYYFVDGYSSQTTLSAFDAYGEIDVLTYLEQSDILVLEVNESKINNMSWGFIDYVLENYK